MSKYWNSIGRYQEDFDRMTDEMMPVSGPCETLGGELVRSANRLYYDAFNNGFCNNTSGAINYIKQYLVPYFVQDKELAEAIAIIEPKTNSGGYGRVDEATGQALDKIVDSVVEFNKLLPGVATIPLPCEMFDLQDDDCYEEEEEEYN